jgi:hypothetical protein
LRVADHPKEIAMFKTITAFLLAALSACPFADLSGSYSGTSTIETPEGTRTRSITLVIKQSAEDLLVTVGPTGQQQHPASNLKLDGDRLTFDLIPPGQQQRAMAFDLKLDGTRLSGAHTLFPRNRDPLTGKIELTRN